MKTVALDSRNMILYLLNFMRYDIPILIAGKSSIGKSYTILELAKQWGMPNSVLYVGSEKADNIEGLPKLIQTESEALTSEKVLEYYKPYWFPKSSLIQQAVKSGQDIFDTKIKPNFIDENSQLLPYETIMSLLWAISNLSFDGNKLTQSFDLVDKPKYVFSDNDNVRLLKKEIEFTRALVPKGEDALLYKNELYELSIYLCTLVGLGNYWLVLDELDKVQEEEADKFAPMLHIVRERRLKNYSLRELNDGKGADVAMNVVGNSYLNIYNTIKNSLNNNLSVLDTRIIAVANKTDNIINISDALFKRFVQVVISDILVLKPVSEKLQKIRTCLIPIETKIENQQGSLTLGKLEEINLQWQFGFLPRILNNQDTSGNFIKNDYLLKIADVINITDEVKRKIRIEEINKSTALYKLCIDNFDDELILSFDDADGNTEKVAVPDLVMDCLSGQIVSFNESQEQEITSNPLDLIREIQAKGFDDKDTAFEVYELLMDKYNKISDSQGNEDRKMILKDLIEYAFSFISYTAYSDGYSEDKIKKGEKYTPLEINKYLIPLVIKFTLKAVTKDAIIDFESKDYLLSRHAELWDNFAIPEHISEIKGDAELTGKLFYGGEDSLWGSQDLNADDFQKSFVNAYNSDNVELFEEFVTTYINMDAEEKSKFSDFIDYINKYRLDDVREIKTKEQNALRLARKLTEATALGKKYNDAFQLG